MSDRSISTSVLSSSDTATMTSAEIAKITGKNHADVCRDLRNLEKQGVIALSSFADREKYGNNNERTVYRLPKRETLILTSGYSAVQRASNEYLINALSVMAPYGPEEKQALLEAPDLKTRAEVLVALAEIELASNGGSGTTLQ